MTLRSQRLQTMKQVRAFLEGSEASDYQYRDRARGYAFARQMLGRLRYEALGRRDKGAVLWIVRLICDCLEGPSGPRAHGY